MEDAGRVSSLDWSSADLCWLFNNKLSFWTFLERWSILSLKVIRAGASGRAYLS
jgi:hypothetical protein